MSVDCGTKKALPPISTVVTGAAWGYTASGPRDFLIQNPVLLVSGGKVAWFGERAKLPRFVEATTIERIQVPGGGLVPGFVDSHTHLVFCGDRAEEFFKRNAGATYQEIARSGGGILATVSAVRKCGDEELYALSKERLDRSLSGGVTTVEVKSGYGLTFKDEVRILSVIERLRRESAQTVVATFLGAHAYPFGLTAMERKEHLDRLCTEWIPEVAERGLAEFTDVFCERGYFSLKESERVLSAGLEHGLHPKLHADQLSRTGACRLGAEMGAQSVDHCDRITTKDARALREAGVTAVLLPGVEFFLNEGEIRHARLLKEEGVEVAIATNCNPGSCMTQNLALIGTIAAIRMKLSALEILRAMTWGGATALRRQERKGHLTEGADADFLILDADTPQNLFYEFGRSRVRGVYIGGCSVATKGSEA